MRNSLRGSWNVVGLLDTNLMLAPYSRTQRLYRSDMPLTARNSRRKLFRKKISLPLNTSVTFTVSSMSEITLRSFLTSFIDLALAANSDQVMSVGWFSLNYRIWLSEFGSCQEFDALVLFFLFVAWIQKSFRCFWQKSKMYAVVEGNEFCEMCWRSWRQRW